MNRFRAEQILRAKYGAHEKVGDLYDGDEELQSMLHALFPLFEYPNFSHHTIGEVLRKYELLSGSVMENTLVLEVKLSVFITVSVDESEPLTREGVIGNVQEYLAQRGVPWENVIDSVRVEEVLEGDADTFQVVPPELAQPDVIGLWSLGAQASG